MKTEKRDSCLLAKTLTEALTDRALKNILVSEKLDGMRFFWDGGISAGVPIGQVPYCNKEKLVSGGDMVATGLWSRYWNPIYAPKEWIAHQKLPQGRMVEGELYMGRGRFQETVSITRSHDNPDWHKVSAIIFDAPSPNQMLRSGIVRINGNQTMLIEPNALVWAQNKGLDCNPRHDIKGYHERVDGLVTLAQTKYGSWQELLEATKTVCANGAEGVMLRDEKAWYMCKRHSSILKLKPRFDGEFKCVGVSTATDGQFAGLIGALTLATKDGRRFDVGSGLTIPDRCQDHDYYLGKTITITYRLSDGDLPKETAFKAVRNYE